MTKSPSPSADEVAELAAKYVSMSNADMRYRLVGNDSFFVDVRRLAASLVSPPKKEAKAEHVGAEVVAWPSEVVIENCLAAMAQATVTYPDKQVSAPLIEWFKYDPQDAVDFGVLETPHFDTYSDIAIMQQEWYVEALLREPFLAALKVLMRVPAAAPQPSSVGGEREEVIDALIEARNQIEYLHGMFRETGSGNAVMAKLDDVRRKLQSGDGK